MYKNLKKYTAMLSSFTTSALEYRANMVGNILVELVSLSGIVVLWAFIYKSESAIAGYTAQNAVLYYILIPFIHFATVSTAVNSFAPSIKSGNISQDLLKPQSISAKYLMSQFSKKASYFAFVIPTYLLIGTVLWQYVSQINLNLTALMLGIFMCVLAFFLHFVVDLFISCLAFWYDDVWAFSHFKIIIFSILGGASFPFEFWPEAWLKIVNLLPFKFMYYVPISYILQLRGPANLIADVMGIAGWTIVFIILYRLAWKKGLNKYEAYGN